LIVLGQLRALSEPEQRADRLRYLAHEAAHMWWRRAPATTWEDWLNESFAEYSALLTIRDVVGEDEFQARIALKREQSEGTHPIWGLDRNDHSSDERSREIRRTLYNKGPTLLDELAERVGRERFLTWCRELVRRDVDSTVELLDGLAEQEGEATSLWFRELLTSR
jgi:aminopeptidase N